MRTTHAGGTMNDEAFDFDLEQEDYSKLLLRMVDGTTIRGTVKTNKRLADEVNSEEGFLVVHDAACRFAGAKGSRQKVIFVNKSHVLWSVPV